MKEKECMRIWLIIAIIALISVTVLLGSNCRKSIMFLSLNELGVIDYYGEIIYGEIPPEVLERIKDKRVEAVSKGFICRYYEMKKLLKSLDKWEWEE